MYLAYFDESGDTGLVNSPTTWFVINAVLVHERDWLATLDALVAMRRWLRDTYGIQPDAELKAVELKRGTGEFSGIGVPRKRRFELYGKLMEFETSLPIRTFSVAIYKAKANSLAWRPVFAAWQFTIERLDAFCRATDEYAMLLPDEGYTHLIRRVLDRMLAHAPGERYDDGPRIQRAVTRIVETPIERNSQASHFVQLADLNAFAAHRSGYVDPVRSTPDYPWDALAGRDNDIRVHDDDGGECGPIGLFRHPRES